MPLLPQIGRRDYQYAPLLFCPLLRQHQARFDRFSKSNLVSQKRPFRKWRMESKERGFDLMRVEVDLGINQRARQLLDTIGRTPFCKLVGKKSCVVRCQRHAAALISGSLIESA